MLFGWGRWGAGASMHRHQRASGSGGLTPRAGARIVSDTHFSEAAWGANALHNAAIIVIVEVCF